MRFIGMVIATRSLAPEDFGAFAQALLIMGLPCVLRDLGLSNALIAYSGQDRRYARFHFQAVLASSLLCAALVPVLARFWSGLASGVAGTTGCLAAIVVIEGLGLTGTVMAQKSFRFKELAGVEISASAGWLALIMFGVGRFPGLWLLVYGRLAEAMIRFLLIGIMETWKHAGFTRERALTHYFLRFARYGAPQAVVESAVSQIDVLLLTTFSTVSQLGVYDRMLQFNRVPLALSINLLDKVALVSFSQHQHEPAQLRRLVRWFAGLSLGAATVVVAGLTVVLPWLLEWMLGRAWMLRLWPLWWAAIPMMILRPTVWCLNIFMQGVGASSALFRSLLFGLTVSGIVGLILVPRYGVAGMLLTQGLAHLLLLAYQGTLIRRWFATRRNVA